METYLSQRAIEVGEFFDVPPEGFQEEAIVVTCFLEQGGNLLLLQRADHKIAGNLWAIPGGKLELNETPIAGIIRELQEELAIQFDPDSLHFQKKLFVRHSIMDYTLHVYLSHLPKIPEISLNKDEHQAYQWQSMDLFHEMPLIEGQLEVFKLIWATLKKYQKISDKGV